MSGGCDVNGGGGGGGRIWELSEGDTTDIGDCGGW